MNVAGNIIDNIFRKYDVVMFCLLQQDDRTHLIIRRFDRRNQTTGKTSLDAVFQLFYILRRAVAGENDVLLIVKKHIECIEDFRLG